MGYGHMALDFLRNTNKKEVKEFKVVWRLTGVTVPVGTTDPYERRLNAPVYMDLLLWACVSGSIKCNSIHVVLIWMFVGLSA